MKLDRTTLDELVDILAPLVTTEKKREALLTHALISDSLLYDIDYSGGAHPFIIRTVSYLASNNEAGFWALLESTYDQVGREQRRRIDNIRDRLNAPPKTHTRYLTWRARCESASTHLRGQTLLPPMRVSLQVKHIDIFDFLAMLSAWRHVARSSDADSIMVLQLIDLNLWSLGLDLG